MAETPHIYLFTDGSCTGTGPGAWASLLVTRGGQSRTLFGYSAHTTINRCELQPIIDGLRWVREELGVGILVRVVTDSENVAKTIGGIYKESANLDLWTVYRLVAEELRVSAVWRTRQSHPGMQYVDALCWSMRKVNEAVFELVRSRPPDIKTEDLN